MFEDIMKKENKKIGSTILFFFLLILFFSNNIFSQQDSVSHRNIGIRAGCSVLEGNAVRAEFPAFFYGSQRHAFSAAATAKFSNANPLRFGINAGYYFYLEPSFRDICFYFNYNVSCFVEKNPAITHIWGIGTQMDIGEKFFLQHSIGLGFQQSAEDFKYLNPAAQLKLSFGYFFREIPVVHLRDGWEY